MNNTIHNDEGEKPPVLFREYIFVIFIFIYFIFSLNSFFFSFNISWPYAFFL